MNEEEFEKYVLTNHEHLYPNVADAAGHRVILKFESRQWPPKNDKYQVAC